MASDPEAVIINSADEEAFREGNVEESTGLRFSAEREAELLGESNEHKSEANKLFACTNFSGAIKKYEEALAVCPNYLDYDIAVLRSNVAACHLKLEDWKAAITAATSSIECLDRLEPKPEDSNKQNERISEVTGEDATVVTDGLSTPVEVIPPPPHGPKHKPEDVQRIKMKALMRRAKARSETGGWAALQAAEEDYKLLSSMNSLPAGDNKIVKRQLASLPPRIEEAKQKEMGEMMGKLKELGNGILKPFGLSTNNFNMVKDDKTGGYSMEFNQGAKK